MLEKRKFIRLKAPLGVVFRVIRKNKRQRTHASFIKDISGEGVCLSCREPLRHGDLLDMEIQIPHLKDPVRAVGEVVWSGLRPERDLHEAGVRFRDVEPKTLSRILEYVYAIAIG